MWYNIESKWTFIIKSIKNQRSLIIKTRNKSLKLLIKKNEQEKNMKKKTWYANKAFDFSYHRRLKYSVIILKKMSKCDTYM